MGIPLKLDALIPEIDFSSPPNRTKWKRQAQQQQQQSVASTVSMADSRPTSTYCQPLLCSTDLNHNPDTYFPYIRNLPSVFSTSCHFT